MRSTEIQTFDRSAVIVPNSNLISGVVKNRVRGDRSGRVSITVSVLRNQDPVRAAEMITACAQGHADVLKDPAPRGGVSRRSATRSWNSSCWSGSWT